VASSCLTLAAQDAPVCVTPTAALQPTRQPATLSVLPLQPQTRLASATAILSGQQQQNGQPQEAVRSPAVLRRDPIGRSATATSVGVSTNRRARPFTFHVRRDPSETEDNPLARLFFF
jgi:hypothetical protein